MKMVFRDERTGEVLKTWDFDQWESANDMISGLAELIACFEGSRDQLYWVGKLDVSGTVKGKLCRKLGI